jgi:hypothetical protein
MTFPPLRPASVAVSEFHGGMGLKLENGHFSGLGSGLGSSMIIYPPSGLLSFLGRNLRQLSANGSIKGIMHISPIMTHLSHFLSNILCCICMPSAPAYFISLSQ